MSSSFKVSLNVSFLVPRELIIISVLPRVEIMYSRYQQCECCESPWHARAAVSHSSAQVDGEWWWREGMHGLGLAQESRMNDRNGMMDYWLVGLLAWSCMLSMHEGVRPILTLVTDCPQVIPVRIISCGVCLHILNGVCLYSLSSAYHF